MKPSLALTAISLGMILNLGCAPFQSIPTLASRTDDSLASRLALARLCEKHNDLQRATSLYKEVLDSDDNSVASRHRLALIAVRKRDFPDAQQWFEKALQLEPDNAVLHNDFGYACFLYDRLDDAQRHLKRAIELKPDMRSAWNNLGLVHGQRQEFQEAREAFRHGLTVPADQHCNLAYVYAQHRLYEMAVKEYQAALELNPECLPAAEGLLQVSRQIRGAEPVTLLVTYPAIRSEPEPSTPSRQTPGEVDSSDSDVANLRAAQADMSGLMPPQSGQPKFAEDPK